MYRYKARITNKATQQITREQANSLTTMLVLLRRNKNVFYHIVRIADNKLMMRGTIDK